MLTDPDAFRLAAIDLRNRTIAKGVTVRGVDHGDVVRHVVEGRGEIGTLRERDRKDDHFADVSSADDSDLHDDVLL